MNKLYLTLTLIFGLTVFSYASPTNNAHAKPISEAKLKRMDHKLTKHKAVKRNFRTQKEFTRSQRKMAKHYKKQANSRNIHRDSRNYNSGYNYNRNDYPEEYRPVRQRGYSHSNRGWHLVYKHDRASFYDNQGYYYGYFNRYGYYFENVFYRYDRFYTYRDRVEGRGLFDHRYYMPANADYYGFCNIRTPNSHYERGYNR